MKKTGVECISVQPSSFFAFCRDSWMSLSTSALSTSREEPRAMVASHSSIRAKLPGTVNATSRMRTRLSCSVFCTQSTTALCKLCLSRNAPSRKPAYVLMPAPWTTMPSLSTMLPHRHTTLELPTSSIVAGFMLPPRYISRDSAHTKQHGIPHLYLYRWDYSTTMLQCATKNKAQNGVSPKKLSWTCEFLATRARRGTAQTGHGVRVGRSDLLREGPGPSKNEGEKRDLLQKGTCDGPGYGV